MAMLQLFIFQVKKRRKQAPNQARKKQRIKIIKKKKGKTI